MAFSFSENQLPLDRRIALVKGFLSGALASIDDMGLQGLTSSGERDDVANAYFDAALRKPHDTGLWPMLIMLGGGPASGKSTLVRRMEKNAQISDFFIMLNGEGCREHIPEYRALRDIRDDHDVITALGLCEDDLARCHKGAQGFVRYEVARLVQEAQHFCLAHGWPLVNESHMHIHYPINKTLKEARAKRFNSLMIQPDVDVDTFFAFGRRRERESGKVFHPELGLRHHQSFETLWPRFNGMFNAALRIDNRGAEPHVMAFSDFGVLTVTDPASYARARHKVNINPLGKTPADALSYPDPLPLPEELFPACAAKVCVREGSPLPHAATCRAKQQFHFINIALGLGAA